VFDTQTQALLQVVFRREGQSFLLYIHDAFPWTESEGEPALERLQRLIVAERDAVNALGRYLLRNRVPLPFLGTYPMSFTSCNFLSLGYVVPKLLEAEKSLHSGLERDLASVPDVGAKGELKKLADLKRAHLEELGSFVPLAA
jgi:hypothetical protein